MLVGPFCELAAIISVSGRATALAVAAIFVVIETVVFGFITKIFMAV
jgi:hypothetical protein